MFDFLKQKDRTPPALPEGTVRRRYSIEGQVQGVGFRYRARYAAQTLELTGWVENEDDGSVTLEVQGDPDKFMRLFAIQSDCSVLNIRRSFHSIFIEPCILASVRRKSNPGTRRIDLHQHGYQLFAGTRGQRHLTSGIGIHDRRTCSGARTDGT